MKMTLSIGLMIGLLLIAVCTTYIPAQESKYAGVIREGIEDAGVQLTQQAAVENESKAACEQFVEQLADAVFLQNPTVNRNKVKAELLILYCGGEQLPGGRVITENGFKSIISYERENRSYLGAYQAEMRQAMAWLSWNVEDNVTVAAWWDHGGMIQAMALKNAVLLGPSKAFVAEMKERYPRWQPLYEEDYEFAPDSQLRDVAMIFMAEDDTIAVALMEKIGADYLVVSRYEVEVGSLISIWATGKEQNATATSLLGRVASGTVPEGFEAVYADGYAIVLRVKQQ